MTIHIPVLLREVVEILKSQKVKVVADMTFGGGGYTKRILGILSISVILMR